MKQIIKNKNNIIDAEVTEIVKRVKALIINDSNEILLGYSYNEYQFPGGHVEEGENLINALNREIKEETGINIPLENIEPFACAYGYYKDYPEIGKNRKNEIYYYIIKTNDLPNSKKFHLTDEEIIGGFELRYISLDELEQELIKNVSEYGDPHGIAQEMLNILKLYKE